MDICRRSVKNLFDVNQNTTSIMSNLVPPTTSNLTVSFNNQINALHTQVVLCSKPLSIIISGNLNTQTYKCISEHLKMAVEYSLCNTCSLILKLQNIIDVSEFFMQHHFFFQYIFFFFDHAMFMYYFYEYLNDSFFVLTDGDPELEWQLPPGYWTSIFAIPPTVTALHSLSAITS